MRSPWEHNGGNGFPELYSSGIWRGVHVVGAWAIELLSAVLALTAGLWVCVLAAKAKLTAPVLIFNGVLYLLFLSVVLRG